MTAVPSSLLRDLSALLGPKGLISDADRAPYERGYRYGAGRAAALIRPADVDQLRSVIRYCHAQDIRFFAQGANTGLVGASTPDDSEEQILISLGHMTAIETLDPLDRSMTVQAGARLSAINAAAAPHDLFFPIDLGADPSIGGMVATNTGGSRMMRYGDVRRNLLGLEVVLPDQDATLLSNLTGLRKDNSGLDWKHLFVGTSGAFGLVTRARIELHAVPRRTAAALVVPQTQAAVPHIIGLLENALGDSLTACEGMSRRAMQAAFDHNPALRRPFGGDIPDYAILVELGTSLSDRIMPDLDSILVDILGSACEGPTAWVQDVLFGRAADFWAIRHSISDGVAAMGQVIAFDISVQRSALPAFRAAAIDLIEREFPQLILCDFGHCGDGGDHFNLVWPDDIGPAREDRAPMIARLRTALYDLITTEFHGSFSAEHGLGPYNQGFYDRLKSAPEQQLTAAIKDRMDPKNLVGNIRFERGSLSPAPPPTA